MDLNIWHLTYLVLAGLAYLLVTFTLTTLACRIRAQRGRHDLVRESRRRRAEYLTAILPDQQQDTY